MEAVYKISHDKYLLYLNALIKPKKLQINLRSDNNICIPQYKTLKYGNNYFTYSAPFYWNKLPNIIRNARSFSNFKTLLRDWYHPVNVDHANNVILLIGEIFLLYHFIINISFA